MPRWVVVRQYNGWIGIDSDRIVEYSQPGEQTKLILPGMEQQELAHTDDQNPLLVRQAHAPEANNLILDTNCV